MNRELDKLAADDAPLDPSDRERELFRRVAIEGRSFDEIAADEKISPRQARRLVLKAERMLALQAFHHEAPWVRAMHLKRLEHQWQETMLAWYRSQRDECVVKVVKKSPDAEPSVESVSSKPSGDVRYLEYARKLLGEIRQLGGVEDLHIGGEGYATVETLTIEQRTAEFYRLVARLREQARSESVDRTGDRPVADKCAAADAPADACAASPIVQAASVSES